MFTFPGAGPSPQGQFGAGGPGAVNPEDWEDFPATPDSGRRPAVKGRITGVIDEWKGKFGWLKPDEPIIHPEARLKGGRIYLSQDDVLEVISGVGAHVSFYVYADGKGLGALNCVPSDSAAAKKKITKSKPKLSAKAKAKATPGRKRVAEDMMYGKVKSWRGGFGFVTPSASSPIEHPLFTGSLFLHKADILTPEDIDVGKKVSFYMYADPQGLGAEECTVVDGDDDADMPPASPGANESSGLLKAKPKASAADGIMIMVPKAKGMMTPKPKAAAAVKASGDPELAKKMAEHPELAKQLSAWMFDPGG